MNRIHILVVTCLVSTIANNLFGREALEVINNSPYILSISHIGWYNTKPLPFENINKKADPIITGNKQKKECWWSPRNISRGPIKKDKLQITIESSGKTIIIPIDKDGSQFTITETSPTSQNLALEIEKNIFDNNNSTRYSCYCNPSCDLD